MEIGEIFFWTATINQWQKLLQPDQYKDVVISSLDYLSNAGKIDVFGFVIMPNHVHLIWRTKELNGKETAQGSFLKYTAHEFRKMLYRGDRTKLLSYKIEADNKEHEFWQRDPLAVRVSGREMASQKLGYMHYNPMQPHWRLCTSAEAYRFSSAAFYETGVDEFGILTHYMDFF